MRLCVISKTHVRVYEGRKCIVVFEVVGPTSPADIEGARTYVQPPPPPPESA